MDNVQAPTGNPRGSVYARVPVRAYIGLGSNLGDPAAQVRRALAALNEIPASHCVARSGLYRSAPLGSADQPDYINAAAALDTRLPAHELLRQLQAIEARQGRVRGPERWAPRTLDLDLLLYGDLMLNEDVLTVPHPGLPLRSFVLYPLRELAPELIVPGRGSLRALIAACPARGLERLE